MVKAQEYQYRPLVRDVLLQVVLPIATLIGGWAGASWKFRSDKKQKEAELDQKDTELAQKNVELAQARQAADDEKVRWQAERDLELIETARGLLRSESEEDREDARMYLRGMFKVSGGNPLVDELLNSLALKEYGVTLRAIRKAGGDAIVVVDPEVDGASITDDVVVEIVEGDDEASDDDAGEEGHVGDEGSHGDPSDPHSGPYGAGPTRA